MEQGSNFNLDMDKGYTFLYNIKFSLYHKAHKKITL